MSTYTVTDDQKAELYSLYREADQAEDHAMLASRLADLSGSVEDTNLADELSQLKSLLDSAIELLSDARRLADHLHDESEVQEEEENEDGE